MVSQPSNNFQTILHILFNLIHFTVLQIYQYIISIFTFPININIIAHPSFNDPIHIHYSFIINYVHDQTIHELFNFIKFIAQSF